jgi:hypothetical protein
MLYQEKYSNTPWWRGAVDIASASGTRRPEFESRQDIKVMGNIAALLCIK